MHARLDCDFYKFVKSLRISERSFVQFNICNTSAVAINMERSFFFDFFPSRNFTVHFNVKRVRIKSFFEDIRIEFCPIDFDESAADKFTARR